MTKRRKNRISWVLAFVTVVVILAGVMPFCGQLKVAHATTTVVVFLNSTAGSTWTPPAGVTSIDVWVLAGGGGGGMNLGGGGGGGGYIHNATYAVTPGVPISYTVGDGGAGGLSGGHMGTVGYDSVFGTLTAKGGGGGGGSTESPSIGGSGGGGSCDHATGADGTSGQGSKGGTGYATGGGGGGGGGASHVGYDAAGGWTGSAGNGGEGISINGVTYGGGGGGGGYSGGPCAAGSGANGGGDGSYTDITDGYPGTANTGGGGGGSSGGSATGCHGGKGGSGRIEITYTPSVYLTTSNTSGGTVLVPGIGTYIENQSQLVNINASAYNCYHFVNWTGDTTNITSTTSANTTINMPTTNQTATANFAINTSVITYSAGIGGTISGSTPQTINCGASTTVVTAIPNACYHFTSWSDANTSATRTDIGTSTNQTFTASFAVNATTLTLSSSDGGNVTTPGEGTFNHNCGDSVEIIATSDTCYHFVNWTGDIGNVTDVNSADTFVSVTGNYSIVANFSITQYTLSINANTSAGSQWFEGTSPFDCGTNTGIHASPTSCYNFVNWTPPTGIADPNSSNTIIFTTANHSITANYVIKTYTLTYNNDSHGTVVGSTPQIVNCGADGTQVTATPNTCYHFVNWSDNVLTASRTDTNVVANLTVTANFAVNSQTLTIGNSSGGIVTSPGQGIYGYNCGDVVGIVASPYTCYKFVNWTGDIGNITNPNASSTSITVNGNYSIQANFALTSFTLTYSAGAGGSVNGSWPQDVNCGSDGPWVLATADPSYIFINWSDSSTINPRHEVSVVSNVSYTANFGFAPPVPYPPTNIVVTETSDDCFDMSWVMGINSTSTMMIICKYIVQPCNGTNMSNLSSNCMVLYNGNGTNLSSCGWDLNNYQYNITAWGVNSVGNFSTGCVTVTVGGERVLNAIYWGLGILVAIFFTALSFWQKKMWLFVLAGIFWWILGIFSMVANAVYTLGWSLGFVYLAIGLVCMLATMWLHEKRDAPMESPQDQGFNEMKERIKERRAKRNDY